MVFQIIESQNIEGDAMEMVQVSQLNFVDLAGFEKIHSTGATEGGRTDASLSAVESRIKQLNKLENLHENDDSCSSKLTDVLQSSLGDNAVLAVICTVTPVALEETYYTLLLVLYYCLTHCAPAKSQLPNASVPVAILPTFGEYTRNKILKYFLNCYKWHIVHITYITRDWRAIR